MTKPYKINMTQLEQRGNIEKFYRDGFTKQQVLDVIHKETDCQNFDHRTRTAQRELVDALFNKTQE